MVIKKLLASGRYVFFFFAPFVYADTHFDPAFFSGDPSMVADLNQIEKNNSVLPGVYSVDVYLNDNFVANKKIKFIASESKPKSADGKSEASNGLAAQFTLQDLIDLGVKTEAFPGLSVLKPSATVDLENAIKDSSVSFDVERLRLNLSIPQAALNNDARGYIPPSKWDQGINALFTNYNLSGNKNKYDSGDSQSDFLSLNSGLNLGAWRLRDNSSWNYDSDSSGDSTSEWQHVSTYVERNVAVLQSEFTAGDTSTRGDLFDSVSIRGVKLETDENMLPDSQKGFAPTIHGIAKSNAKVTIKQNGYNLYQTYVPPGPFVINDLFPTSSSGDLEVTITEADGSTQNFTVPFSSVPGLQREGHIKYSLSAGKYHSGSEQQDEPDVGQFTLFWGGPWGTTFYGGAQFSDNYTSYALGTGANFGDLGAIAMDITQASSTLTDGSHHSGESLRFLYDKTLDSVGTTLNLMGYRYSTEGYYTLSDTTYKMMSGYNYHGDDKDYDDNHTKDGDDEPDYADYYDLWYTKKGKMQVSINQTLGKLGSLYISGTQQTYWHTDEKDSYIQMGYNGNLRDISYGLSYSYNKSMNQPKADQIFALTLSLPLGRWLSSGDSGDITHHASNAYLTYNTSTDNNGQTTQLAGISGSMLADDNLSYSVQQGYTNQGQGGTGNANLNYRGTYNNMSLGYNYSSDQRQVNYGVSGGIMLHRNGLTLSQPLGDTDILVAAPGAGHVTIENNTGVKTDWRGYAVIPYATTYRMNRVALDTTTLDQHTDLESSVVDVVPTQGAIVRAQFTPHVGVRALFTLMHQNKPLPFGTMITRHDGGDNSIVGDDGQLYLSALPLSGILDAQWGNQADQRCTVHFELPESAANQTVTNVTAECR